MVDCCCWWGWGVLAAADGLEQILCRPKSSSSSSSRAATPSSGGEPLRTLRLTGSPPTSRGAANSVFSGPANYSWAHGPSYSVMLTEKTMAWTPTKPTHRWPPVGPVSDDDVLSSHSCLMMIATKMLA